MYHLYPSLYNGGEGGFDTGRGGGGNVTPEKEDGVRQPQPEHC